MQHLQLFEDFQSQPNYCLITYPVPRVSDVIPPKDWQRYEYRIRIPLDLGLENPGLVQDLLDFNFEELAFQALQDGKYSIERPSPPHPDSSVRGVFTSLGVSSHLNPHTKDIWEFMRDLHDNVWWELRGELSRLGGEGTPGLGNMISEGFPQPRIEWI